jgi:RimJ/RimL family protein N-acetyltransferase
MAAVTEACEISGAGLLLRPWSHADIAQVAAASLDPEIMRWNPIATASAADWCAVRRDWSAGDHASWAVTRSGAPETVCGAVSLHHIDHEQSNSEVGYWIGPEHRRAGLAVAALEVAAGFGFEVLGLRRVHLFHAIENQGSCRVATAAGFPYEGTHRQSYRFGDGQWHDEHSHARLNDDGPTGAERR